MIQAKTMTLRDSNSRSLSDVASVSPDRLVDGGEYSMHFEYQDAKGNIAAQSATVAGLI